MSAPARLGDGASVVPEADAKQEHGKVTSSYSIFLIVAAIVFLAIAVVFGVNTFFYDKIRKSGCSSSISSSEATALFWTNLVLAVIAGIMFIVSIILMFTETKAPTYANKYLGRLRYEGELKAQLAAAKAKAAATAAKPYAYGAAAGFGAATQGFGRAVGATAQTAANRIFDEGRLAAQQARTAFEKASLPKDPTVNLAGLS